MSETTWNLKLNLFFIYKKFRKNPSDRQDLNASTNSNNSPFNQTTISTASSNTSAYYTSNSSIVSQTTNSKQLQQRQQPPPAQQKNLSSLKTPKVSNNHHSNTQSNTIPGSASQIKSTPINSTSSGIIPNHKFYKNNSVSVTPTPSTVRQANLYSAKK